MIFILQGCKEKNENALLNIDNKTNSTIYVMIDGYSAIDHQPAYVGGFYGIIEPDSSFTIETSNSEFYLTSDELSPIYNTSDSLDLEVFVFKGQNEDYEYFTGLDRDTLYLERLSLSMLLSKPINITIE